MREEFEKLQEIEVRLRENPDIRFEGGDYVYRGQALSKFNVNVAVAAGYVSGAWHAYQEQWERFNNLRRPELDSDTCSDIRNHVSPLTKVIDR